MFKVIELFSGIGSQAQALKMLGANAEIVGTSEIDKKAIRVYEAIHGKTKQYGDISKVEKLDYADLWTYSFPCQDITSMGNQRGLSEGSGTRSSLVFEVMRLLGAVEEKERPAVLLLENVEALYTKFRADFDLLRQRLSELGYVTDTSMFDVIDAVDYGIPQTRKRLIAVSFLRSKLPKNGNKFVFPYGDNIGYRPNYVLRDFLEESTAEIMERFAVKEVIVNDVKERSAANNDIVTHGVQRNGKINKFDLSFDVSRFKQRRRVIETNGICPTLLTTGGIGAHKIFVNDEYITDDNCGFMQEKRVKSDIRFMTPREYWRLMGFDDNAFEKAAAELGNPYTNALYKQAGNSIVTNVLYFVFKNIIDSGIIEGADYDRSRGDAEKLKLDFLQNKEI